MRKEAITDNRDGTYCVTGGGWFWCKIKRQGDVLSVIGMAQGMMTKKATRKFLLDAKAGIKKHYPA